MFMRSAIQQIVRLRKSTLWPLIATVVAGAAFATLELEKNSNAVDSPTLSGKIEHASPKPGE